MNEPKKQKFADDCAAKLSELILKHFDNAEESAIDSIDESSDKPVLAKISNVIYWEAGSESPKVKMKVNYTTSHKDEIEWKFDPDQMTFAAELDARIEGMGGNSAEA